MPTQCNNGYGGNGGYGGYGGNGCNGGNGGNGGYGGNYCYSEQDEDNSTDGLEGNSNETRRNMLESNKEYFTDDDSSICAEESTIEAI